MNKWEKSIGQLVKDKHWSVEGLAKAINITQEDIRKWEKLNKPYKKSKKKYMR